MDGSVRKIRRSGNPNPQGNKGKGRPKGCKNKVTRELKDQILGALEAAGNAIDPGKGALAYLQRQAEDNPGPFLALIGKVLPSTINATLGNPDGSKLAITVKLKRQDDNQG